MAAYVGRSRKRVTIQYVLLAHVNDSEAHEYVRRNVGIAAAKAYRCLNAPAWCGFSSGLVSADELSRSLCLSRRADLFRFAALYAAVVSMNEAKLFT